MDLLNTAELSQRQGRHLSLLPVPSSSSTSATLALNMLSLSQASDLVPLFHHHHVVFHKQHLGCRQPVKQKKHCALPQQDHYLKPGKKSES